MTAADLAGDLMQADPQLAQLIDAERQRQEQHIELIASENYCSPAVLQAQGSLLTNKYADGDPWAALLRWLRGHRSDRGAGD